MCSAENFKNWKESNIERSEMTTEKLKKVWIGRNFFKTITTKKIMIKKSELKINGEITRTIESKLLAIDRSFPGLKKHPRPEHFLPNPFSQNIWKSSIDFSLWTKSFSRENNQLDLFRQKSYRETPSCEETFDTFADTVLWIRFRIGPICQKVSWFRRFASTSLFIQKCRQLLNRLFFCKYEITIKLHIWLLHWNPLEPNRVKSAISYDCNRQFKSRP